MQIKDTSADVEKGVQANVPKPKIVGWGSSSSSDTNNNKSAETEAVQHSLTHKQEQEVQNEDKGTDTEVTVVRVKPVTKGWGTPKADVVEESTAEDMSESDTTDGVEETEETEESIFGYDEPTAEEIETYEKGETAEPVEDIADTGVIDKAEPDTADEEVREVNSNDGTGDLVMKADFASSLGNNNEDIFAATDVFNMAENEMAKSKKPFYKKPTFWMLGVLGIGIAILGFMLARWTMDGMETREILEDVGGYTADIEIIPPETATSANTYRYSITPVDLNEMIDKNTDTVGYLQYEHFDLAMPVVQTNNNIYYLEHNYEKKESSAGWIYLDYQNNISMVNEFTNNVIYGHNMRDGSMFGVLSEISNGDVKKEKDRLIVVQTYDKIYVYEVFSSYVTDVEFDYIHPAFNNREEYNTFLGELIKRNELSELDTDSLNVDEISSILTLSTCSGTNDRRAIHARLVEVQFK